MSRQEQGYPEGENYSPHTSLIEANAVHLQFLDGLYVSERGNIEAEA